MFIISILHIRKVKPRKSKCLLSKEKHQGWGIADLHMRRCSGRGCWATGGVSLKTSVLVRQWCKKVRGTIKRGQWNISGQTVSLPKNLINRIYSYRMLSGPFIELAPSTSLSPTCPGTYCFCFSSDIGFSYYTGHSLLFPLKNHNLTDWPLS